MSGFNLNEHHDTLVLNCLRFAKFQRGQCLKQISECFKDAMDMKLTDETYTVDEVKEVLRDISSEVCSDIESELINSAHTNVLLLQQIFGQAEKWHLNLDADLAELENRELLDKVKSWEDNELASQMLEKPHISPKKRLAPLGTEGPVQLLNLQITELGKENQMLKEKVKSLETVATSALSDKEAQAEKLSQELRRKEEELAKVAAEKEKEENTASAGKHEELSEAVKAMKFQMASAEEINKKNQEELESDLTSTKHHLLDIQHQLNMAEKELEKKFSQTGAYKNLKKMLNSKNDQIKDLRSKLKDQNGGESGGEEE